MAINFMKIFKGLSLKGQSSAPVTNVEDGDMYYDSTDQTFYGRAGSLWKDMLSEGGQGGINYIENHSAEDGNTTGWAVYADAAATTPVDGTGGSPSSTLLANAVNPLRGAYSFKFSHTSANRQGEGFSYDFTIDSADKNKQLWISFDCDLTDSDLVAGDFKCYIYDKDTSTLITPSYTDIAAAKYQFKASFNATSSVNYRLIIHLASSDVEAIDTWWDNFKVGPEELVQTTPVSDWVSYTPTFGGFGTCTSVDFGYKRVGDSIVVRGRFTTGTAIASLATVSLPNGYTAYFPNAGSGTNLVGRADQNGTANVGVNTLAINGSNTLTFGFINGSSLKLSGVNGDTFASSLLTEVFTTLIPITQLQGSSVGLSNSRVEYAAAAGTWDADDTTTVYGPRGQAITGGLATTRTKDITWLTPIQPTDHIFVEVDLGNGFGPVPNAAMDAYMRQNTLYYGVSCYQTGTYTTRVNFGRDAKATGSTFGSGGSTYSSGWRWRVVKSSNPLSIGMPTLYKWQTKYLSSGTISSDTNPLTDLSFTLEPGKTYRITSQVKMNALDGGNSYYKAFDDSSEILRAQLDFGATADDDGSLTFTVSVIHTMTSASLTFGFDEDTNGNLYGTGGLDGTWVQVEELPYHIETSEW